MRTITYHYDVGGIRHSHAVQLAETGDDPYVSYNEPAAWTALSYEQCKGCPLQGATHCPVALRLQKPIRLLDKLYSYEEIDVVVETPERQYRKTTSVQEGLSGLFGLIMARSGCPVFEPFRGLAWFHLPFSSIEETLFRIGSATLLRRYLRELPTESDDALIEHIKSIYQQVYQVNRGMIKRLKSGAAPQCDSPFNAITLLDSLGAIVEMSVEDGMAEIRHHFA